MIVGIHGKIQHGKDTVCHIAQYLLAIKDGFGNYTLDNIVECLNNYNNHTNCLANKSGWEIKSFADKLKYMVCILIGCTRDQLEDIDFKNRELGEEWWYFDTGGDEYIPYVEGENDNDKFMMNHLVKLTPRKLLQLLGTDCGRYIVHPNIWVNALFSEYKAINIAYSLKNRNGTQVHFGETPNWLIKDVRFLNEVAGIRDRKGIVIKVTRHLYNLKVGDVINSYGNIKTIKEITHRVEDKVGEPDERCWLNGAYWWYEDIALANEHESETALDDFNDFDYNITNNGTLLELVQKVKHILKQEKLL